jgi:hypothetical protein
MGQVAKKKQSITKPPQNYKEFDDTWMWETGLLGASEEFARPVSLKKTKEIHKAMGIESVIVRMPKGLGDELRKLAKKEKMGYTPFIRDVLDKYVCQALSTKQRKQRKAG